MLPGPSARRFLPLILAAALLLVTGGTAAASGPTLDLEPVSATRTADAPTPAAAARTARGFDISWPQCGAPYPANPAFGIVGVNRGIVFSANPCLASEIGWAGGGQAQLYANTGNPGPALSSHWPVGQTSPQTCAAADPDSAGCAYDYGWNAAADSYATAAGAWTALGLAGSPAAVAWWLDVETSNSWRTDVSLNVAALRGAVAYLESVGVTQLGFYSTTAQWTTITGGTTAFAAHPAWGAGAPSEAVARRHCRSTPGFTGGRLALVQYPYAGFDADLAC